MDGAGQEMHAGDTDAWLAKYDSAGTRQWIRQLGTTTHDHSTAVTTDSAGNIYITGETFGDLDGSGAAVNTILLPDAWFAKYDSSGAFQWIKQLEVSGQEWSKDIAVDSAGNIYVTGDTRSIFHPIDWQGFLAKYIP